MTQLIRKLETLLFITREPLKRKKAAELLEIDQAQLQELIQALQQEYDRQEKGISLLLFEDYMQWGTNERHHELIQRALYLAEDRGLGRATMEVLSIIAYRQPITKVEIDHIRGVNSDYSIRLLLDRQMIESRGHLDTIGNPKLYVTTELFLRNFNLSNLEELPEVEA